MDRKVYLPESTFTHYFTDFVKVRGGYWRVICLLEGKSHFANELDVFS